MSGDVRSFDSAAARLLGAVSQGQALPPLPDADSQRHFAAALARYKDCAETLLTMTDPVEANRACRAIEAASDEFRRFVAAVDK